MTASIIKQTLSIALVSAFLAQPAAATPSTSDLQQFDALYNQLLADPTNLDLTVAYAELAVEMGDYEAAVPPLERLLMSNPELPKIKLELGILYYLLGSYDISKTYLHDAKVNGDNNIVAQADDYLARM